MEGHGLKQNEDESDVKGIDSNQRVRYKIQNILDFLQKTFSGNFHH